MLKLFRDLIVSNWWLKLSALLLAYVLWILVRGDEAERVFTVPLTVQVPRNMEIVNERPATVEVTASGGSVLTGRLPDMTYTIDLHTASEGSHTVPLTPDGVQVSPTMDVRVVRVSPARVTVVLERIISKNVPVRVPLQGRPAAGMDVYRVSVVPTRVVIQGRSSLINAISEVTTTPVDLADQQESFQTKVNIRLQSDDIHASPADVQATVEIGAHRVEQTVAVPVTLSNPEAFTASPHTVSVSALVPEALNVKLAPRDFRALVAVPAEEATQDRITAKPEVELTTLRDASIKITQVKPETVTLVRKSGKK